MDEPAVVTPPHLGRPLRLTPFRGLTLAPRWIGGPATARTFARPYREVARRLTRWERAGRVSADVEPAVYLHEYTVGDTTVRGLVGALDLTHRSEDPGQRAVLPHEGVHLGQVQDLAERMLEMQLNPAPILLVHRGPAEVRGLVTEVAGRPPTRAFLDAAGTRHRLWAIREAGELTRLAAGLADATPVIADGHHRYAAYLRLQDAHPGSPWDRGLTMLVDQDDTPLRLGAIHRVVPRMRMDELAALAGRAPGGRWRELAGAAEGRALVTGRDGDVASVAVTDGGERWVAWDLPHPADAATVEVLHQSVMADLPRRRRVRYEHSADDACTRARETVGLALLLPTPSFDLVAAVVRADRLLPEKATSFQPKPAVGVLMRSLRDESADPS
ncbi:DUF1015 family protein [Nocardioides sp.]|uniref:DUF1015 family protein n=1 Tax=Nocardioides sp. TaxID=35761 RepID=UPI00352710F3